MPESEEVLQLRRRARRRLIGAAALVLFLVVVPPMLMDLEPKPVSSNLSVEIPKPDSSKLPAPTPPVDRPAPTESAKPRAGDEIATPPSGVPAGVAKAPAPAKADDKAEPAESGKAPPPTVAKEAPKEASKEPPKPAARSKADDAKLAQSALSDATYFVQIGVYANAENAKQQAGKAASTGLKVYTEPAKGEQGEPQTRVRVGPFATREAAEEARNKLKNVGLTPGPVRNK